MNTISEQELNLKDLDTRLSGNGLSKPLSQLRWHAMESEFGQILYNKHIYLYNSVVDTKDYWPF